MDVMIPLSAAKCRINSGLVFLLSISGISWGWAGYRLVLKDGSVIEAQGKPILLEGHYQFTDIDQKFHSLQDDLLDETATITANNADKTVRKGKVFTNDDLESKSPEPVPATPPETKKSEIKAKTDDLAKSGQRTEAYWRGEVRKLRGRIAPFDLEIERLKNEIKTAGNGGFDVSTGLQRDKMYIVDRDSRLKRLEKQRADLQQQLDALEEKGRKAGAPPGWFR
jgi:predicted RNase H-like nuclease (RuvC/YqgF family)